MSYTPPSSAKPFTLRVPEQDLDEWRQLLKLSKLPPQTWEGSQEDGRFGVTRKWIEETRDYWLNTYSWRDEEARINSFPNYRMAVDGVDVHFIALFSENKDAIPIQFLHGWPGSCFEFIPMLDLIQSQYDAKTLPYHIIVPSLPGFPLSTRPMDRDFTLEESSDVLNQLMVNLGFSKYIAQGGDFGSMLAMLGANRHDECVAIHLNMYFKPETPDEARLTEEEKRALARGKQWSATGSAYLMEHGTRPSTIGSVLSSSPLALMTWIGEKMIEWSDTTPPLADMLTNISLYWFTNSVLTSIQPYRQLPTGVGKKFKFEYVSKPVGFSRFPQEPIPAIRHIVEKGNNLVAWTEHDRGGHFAALEVPSLLWGDVKSYVAQVWGKV